MRVKSYTASGYGNRGLTQSGGTLSLPLLLSGNPTQPLEAVTKYYVDYAATHLDASQVVGGFSAERLPAYTGVDIYSSGGGVFTLTPTGVTPGTYTKVTVDAKGRVTSGSYLTLSDVPSLDWSKIVSDKPTTLAGYGITDAVSLSGGTMTGQLFITATPTDAAHAVTKAYVDAASVGGGGSATFSVGDVIYKGVSTTPSGYLKCNGGLASKTTYAGLYAVIGDRYTLGTLSGSGKPWKTQYDINTTQSTDITGWAATTSLPGGLYNSHAVVTKNRVYLLGGCRASALDTVYTAPINADGTLGTWTTGTPLPSPLHGGQAIVTKNRVHLLGGLINNSTPTNTVYTAPINADGTLGAWATGTSLPNPIHSSQAIVTKNRVYMLGGYSDYEGGITAVVYTAPINEDGTLGDWSVGTSIPIAMYASQAIVTKNRVYLLGGYNGGSGLATVYTAPINADGTLGTWTTGTSLPNPLYFSQAVVTRDRVYLMGGNLSGGGVTTTVYTAPVNADGTLGQWATGTALSVSNYGGEAIVIKNRIYLLGTYNGSAAAATVITASFSGGTNDNSSYYGANIATSDYFGLPNTTRTDPDNTYSYIKY